MNIFEKFKILTNIDLKNFYQSIFDFFDNYHQEIVDYYTNYDKAYPAVSFEKLNILYKNLETIISKITFYKENFENIEIWNLIEELDEFKFKLEKIQSYPKFYQVGFYKEQNNTTNNFETYILKAHETIESVARDYNQNIDDLIIINKLNEEKWTTEGGTKIILKSSISDVLSNVESSECVFDILLGKNLLGKDFPNYFNIEDGDLEVLIPEKTFLQSVQNLFQLKQGGIPEYPTLGISKDLFVETKGDIGFYFPIILRQLMSTIESDDTILNFEVENIDVDKQKDSILFYINIQNRLFDNLKFITNLE